MPYTDLSLVLRFRLYNFNSVVPCNRLRVVHSNTVTMHAIDPIASYLSRYGSKPRSLANGSLVYGQIDSAHLHQKLISTILYHNFGRSEFGAKVFGTIRCPPNRARPPRCGSFARRRFAGEVLGWGSSSCGAPGAGRPFRTNSWRDPELCSRAVSAAWADGPHGWRRRVQIGHWKRVTGIRAPGDRFEQSSDGMSSSGRVRCVGWRTGRAAGAHGLTQNKKSP